MRRRAFGSIRKLPSGRFQARYKGPDGLERTGERTFEFKGDAQLYLSQIETDMYAGTWSDPRSASETLEHYAETCLANRPRRLKPRTLERYQDLLRLHINPQLGRMPVRRITAAEVHRWHAGRLANTGEATARQAYALLRMILATAVREQYLMSNPCQIPGAGVARSPERPYMDRTQARALVNAMPADLRTLTIITLLAHLRRGEVLALRRGDVDLDKGTLTICRAITLTKAGPVESTTKTGHARVIHLPAEALESVSEHLEASGPALPSARLFVHHSGRPLEAHHIRTA